MPDGQVSSAGLEGGRSRWAWLASGVIDPPPQQPLPKWRRQLGGRSTGWQRHNAPSPSSLEVFGCRNGREHETMSPAVPAREDNHKGCIGWLQPKLS